MPNAMSLNAASLNDLRVDGDRLWRRLEALGEIGAVLGPNGERGCARLALTDADRAYVLSRLRARLTSDGELVLSSDRNRDQPRNVEDVLDRLKDAPRRKVLVLNKIDLLPDPQQAQELAARYPNGVAISAQEGLGMEQLLAAPSPAAALGSQMGFDLPKLPPGMDLFTMLANLPAAQRTQLLATMNERFAALDENMLTQMAIQAVKAEYAALGLDTGGLQLAGYSVALFYP